MHGMKDCILFILYFNRAYVYKVPVKPIMERIHSRRHMEKQMYEIISCARNRYTFILTFINNEFARTAALGHVLNKGFNLRDGVCNRTMGRCEMISRARPIHRFYVTIYINSIRTALYPGIEDRMKIPSSLSYTHSLSPPRVLTFAFS